MFGLRPIQWTLSDGTEFRHFGFKTADVFYVTDYEIRVRSFIGRRDLSESDAIKVAKEWAKRLNPKVKLKGRPSIEWPNLPRSVVVPRCLIEWEETDSTSSVVKVEVDVDSGAVKSLDVRGPDFSLKSATTR